MTHKAVRLNIYKSEADALNIGFVPFKRITCTVEQFQRAYPKMKGNVVFRVDSVQPRSNWCTPLNERGVNNLLTKGHPHDY